jgi:hypothetical protein
MRGRLTELDRSSQRGGVIFAPFLVFASHSGYAAEVSGGMFGIAPDKPAKG